MNCLLDTYCCSGLGSRRITSLPETLFVPPLGTGRCLPERMQCSNSYICGNVYSAVQRSPDGTRVDEPSWITDNRPDVLAS